MTTVASRVGRVALGWGGRRVNPCRLSGAFARRPIGLIRRDGGKSRLSQMQRECAAIVFAPGRHAGLRPDLLDEAAIQEFRNELLGGSALQARRDLGASIEALRCAGQEYKLGIAEFHGLLHRVVGMSAATAAAPRRPKALAGTMELLGRTVDRAGNHSVCQKR